MRNPMQPLLMAFLATVALLCGQVQERENPVPSAVSRETFDRWFVEISNNGRWGPLDELGTLNLITSEKRRSAAQNIRHGVSVSLAHEMAAGPDLNATVPMALRQEISDDGPDVTWLDDELSIGIHGWAYSHIDALSHTAFRGQMYNTFGRDSLKSGTIQPLRLQVMHSGIISRGYLVDIPRLRGIPYLEPGTSINERDLDQWVKYAGVKVEDGDVLLIRTGRWARAKALGNWEAGKASPGPHPSVALWLRKRGVAALGSDVANEIYPSVVSGLSNPLHELALVSMGMPLMDNLDLEAVASEAAARSQWTFFFIAAPLRVKNGSGSLVNPLAVF